MHYTTFFFHNLILEQGLAHKFLLYIYDQQGMQAAAMSDIS